RMNEVNEAIPFEIASSSDKYRSSRNYTTRKLLPVSIKTRIGYDEIVTEDWISNLLEAEPANISIHGRTLIQMYTGLANWKEIGKAAKIIKKTNTSVLGNGDVKSIQEAKEKAKQYNLDGVLIGRASFGNPWLFKEYEPTNEERIKVAIEHCKTFAEMTPELHFLSLRKHLAWYTKGIPGSNELRTKLMTVQNVEDVKKILQN
ncbi:MAG TPA: tRNA-dihydrouridine synthase, partial [Candidatus Woesebacteria bacterium]|nr:tRNA-dihydrouridine synthase [Candidatus Woesebacteria bacterium]